MEQGVWITKEMIDNDPSIQVIRATDCCESWRTPAEITLEEVNRKLYRRLKKAKKLEQAVFLITKMAAEYERIQEMTVLSGNPDYRLAGSYARELTYERLPSMCFSSELTALLEEPEQPQQP